MATLQQLEAALKNADAAGDMDAARKLAAAVTRARQDKANLIPDTQVPETIPQAPEPTVGERVVGAGETALTLATGATGGTLGMLGGTLKGLAEQILSGQFGTPEAANLVEQEAIKGAQALTYAPRTAAGQEMAAATGEAIAQTLPATPLTAEMGALAAGTRAAMPAVHAAAGTRAAMPAVHAAAQRAAQPAITAAQKVAQQARESVPFVGKSKASISEILKTQPDNPDVVGYKLIGERVVPDVSAQETIKQGWKPGVIATVKAASPEDRSAMRSMLNIFKAGEKSEKFRATTRPTDVLGKTVSDRVNFLIDQNKAAGREIEQIANSQLRGKKVDYSGPVDQLISDLDSLGVKVQVGDDGVARGVFRNSDLQGDKQAKRIINAVLDRVSNVSAPDAYGLHTAKRFIDTQVSYGKKNASPLATQAERVLKNFRRNLNTVLGENFTDYATANAKYSDTIGALSDYQKSVGSTIDLKSPHAAKALGTASRRMLSNAQSRVGMIDSLDKLNATASKYGKDVKGDAINQLIFANELDSMFGAAAGTSLKGQVEQAVKTVGGIARGNSADKAINLLAAGLEKARGINKENAIKSMEALLNE